MHIFQTFISLLAPIFLIISPVTSYMDQILSMHRTHSSHGFSLDIPLIMLTASTLKIFYWPGARFDSALLIQAFIMLAVQAALLKVALDNRVAPLRPSAFEMKINGGGIGEKRLEGGLGVAPPMWAPAPALGSARDELRRPWGFWRWKEESAYWRFVAGLACGLAAVHMLIRPGPGRAESYTMVLGALGLGIEALLPIPQLWQNYRGQSCKGFRLSVLINWLFGDTMKMVFFFMSEQGMIPWSFKACGVFQALCDLGLGVQYWMYGEGLDYDMNGHFA